MQYMPMEDIDKVMDMMNYVRKHTDFTGRDLGIVGYTTIMLKYFDGKPNQIRKAAGLPPASKYKPGWSGRLGPRQ